MSTIDPASRLLAQIREQVRLGRDHPTSPRKLGTLSQSPAGGQTAIDQTALAEAARAVVAIRADDPDRNRKAFRIYLRAVLSTELSDYLHGAVAGLDELVDGVLLTMEQDNSLQEAIGRAGDMLLAVAKKA